MLNNVDIDNLLITFDEIAYVMGNLIDWCLMPTLVVGLGILTHMIPTYTQKQMYYWLLSMINEDTIGTLSSFCFKEKVIKLKIYNVKEHKVYILFVCI
jgi:hypothetical protein